VLTIILTATAFMFIISDNLPKVQYNTAIDYYMLPSTISLALMATLRCLWCLGCPSSGMALGGGILAWSAPSSLWWSSRSCLLAKHVARQGVKTGQIDRAHNKNWYCFRCIALLHFYRFQL